MAKQQEALQTVCQFAQLRSKLLLPKLFPFRFLFVFEMKLTPVGSTHPHTHTHTHLLNPSDTQSLSQFVPVAEIQLKVSFFFSSHSTIHPAS